MKNTFKTIKQVSEIIESREERLKSILATEKPKNEALCPNHKRRISNAREYLKELEMVKKYLDIVTRIDIVPLETLNKQLDGADYCSMLYDAEYVVLAEISNNPFDTKDKRFKDFFIMWMKPLNQL